MIKHIILTKKCKICNKKAIAMTRKRYVCKICYGLLRIDNKKRGIMKDLKIYRECRNCKKLYLADISKKLFLCNNCLK